MSNIEKTEQKIARLREDLSRAKEKRDEWNGKVGDLEKQLETAENLRIVQIVRNTEITPDMLKLLLKMQNDEDARAAEILPKLIKNERINDETSL